MEFTSSNDFDQLLEYDDEINSSFGSATPLSEISNLAGSGGNNVSDNEQLLFEGMQLQYIVHSAAQFTTPPTFPQFFNKLFVI